MKKILSLILAAALLCTCAFALTSCGNGLEGTYEGEFFTDEKDIITITFGEDNAVEISLSVENGESTYKATGTYKMEVEEDHGHEVISFDISGENIGNRGMTFGDRAGFVQYHGGDALGLLQRLCGAEQDAVFRALARARHDSHRRGQTQRAGAGDDQH